ncbi:MAG: hypothetical protein KC547_22405, partial [Anaerolineae bacterium]|nr:hypothetical protein [Anaerolineae bacterium]
GFGFPGAAPISPYRMPVQNRRWRWLAAVAAGPVSNLLLAIIFALIFRILGLSVFDQSLLTLLLIGLVSWNVLLFLFNLLPLFPIDGWHIVYSLLPPDLAIQWERHQQTTQYVFLGLLLLSFLNIPGIPNIFGLLIGGPSNALLRFLLT